jgi:cytochrome c peroxidase
MAFLHLCITALLMLASAIVASAASGRSGWSAHDVATLQSLWLHDLEPLPPDPGNRVADDPRAAALGERLFFDTRLSANGRVSCGQCHQPDRAFQDGRPLGQGVGITARRTMPIAGTARAPFLFWDGRKDSQWAQALGPLESAVEHGGTRAQYAHLIARHYRGEYEAVFGALPDLSAVPAAAGPAGDAAAAAAWRGLDDDRRREVTRVFVNIGKAIAAYERRLEVAPSRFDVFVGALLADRPTAGVLSHDEVAGLALFIGRAQCTQCHNGPLFTNQEFHNTGVPVRPGLPPDDGRLSGATAALGDEFSCRSEWSDAGGRCPELAYLVTGDHAQQRAFKVPSLRQVAERAPFMHAGQMATLAQVLDHYNRAPVAPAGHSELRPLGLGARQLRQLEAFLHTLSSPVNARTVRGESAAR